MQPSGSGGVEVRPLSPSDLPAVVEVHLRAFPASAMSRLGRGTLHRYYEWQLTGPHDVHAIGAVAGGRLVGFCFGGVFRGAIGGFVRRNRWYLGGQVLIRLHLVAGPLFRERLRTGIETLRRGRPSSAPAAPRSRPRSFGILAIAVDPDAQGGGVGAALMRAAEAEAVARSFGQMHLSVHPTNRQAVAFYERLGWVRVDAPGGWQGAMRKELSQ